MNAGRNLWIGATASAGVDAGDINATACAGIAEAPAPAPGTMCLYILQTTNMPDDGLALFAGVFSSADAADSHGFVVGGTSSGAGTIDARFVWAYRAP